MEIEDIVKYAGNILKEEYLKLPDVSVKEKYDLVTESDKKIERAIIEKIVQRYPNGGIYSEECGELRVSKEWEQDAPDQKIGVLVLRYGSVV